MPRNPQRDAVYDALKPIVETVSWPAVGALIKVCRMMDANPLDVCRMFAGFCTTKPSNAYVLVSHVKYKTGWRDQVRPWYTFLDELKETSTKDKVGKMVDEYLRNH